MAELHSKRRGRQGAGGLNPMLCRQLSLDELFLAPGANPLEGLCVIKSGSLLKHLQLCPPKLANCKMSIIS